MKVSELIAGLKRMQDAYGDLPVCVSLATEKGTESNQIISDDNITLAYNQMSETEDEIGIQNFPY